MWWQSHVWDSRGKERVSTLVVQISLTDGLESIKVFIHIYPNIYIDPIKIFDGLWFLNSEAQPSKESNTERTYQKRSKFKWAHFRLCMMINSIYDF